MHLHALQHVPFEDPAYIDRWADDHGHHRTVTRLDEGQPLPADLAFDLLVVMGGPMGARDESQYPWLIDEKRFIARAIDAGRPVLGICLGAQLIADVLGAAIRQNAHKEIGWFDVSKTASGNASTFFADLPDRFAAFHWHGQTFDLPAGAIHLARSTACDNQAFEYAGHVLALQFHLEATAASIARMVHHGADELTVGPYIHNPATMQRSDKQLAPVNRLMATILDQFTRIESPGREI